MGMRWCLIDLDASVEKGKGEKSKIRIKCDRSTVFLSLVDSYMTTRLLVIGRRLQGLDGVLPSRALLANGVQGFSSQSAIGAGTSIAGAALCFNVR